MKNNGYIWGIVLAVLIIVAAIFLFRVHKAGAPSGVASSTDEGTTTVDLGNGNSVTLPPGVTIVSTSSPAGANAVQPPSLTGAIIISPSLASDAAAAIRAQENILIPELKVAPTREDLWLKLGVDRQIAGDYAGAEAAWGYVAKTAPSSISYIAYGNLGSVYMNNDKNLPKAETDYKAAISLSPQTIDYYRELFYLYGTEGNAAAQKAILAQGLKANPNNPDLLQLQQQTKTQ